MCPSGKRVPNRAPNSFKTPLLRGRGEAIFINTLIGITTIRVKFFDPVGKKVLTGAKNLSYVK
jgi:hypothetical protein